MTDLPLTKEDIEFLTKLAHELKTQDTACTRNPVYYTILQKDKEYGIDLNYADGMVAVGDEGEPFECKDDLMEWLLDNYELNNSQQEDIGELQDLEEICDFCKINDICDLTYTGYRNIEKEDGVFLTKKALKDHVKKNHYHYKANPVSYAHHAWRNPEFERLLGIVEKFATADTEAANE